MGSPRQASHWMPTILTGLLHKPAGAFLAVAAALGFALEGAPCLSFSPFSPPLPSRLRPRPRTHRAGRKMSRSNIIPNVAFGFGPDGPVRGSVSPFTPSPSPLPRSCSTFADSWGVRIRRQRSWSECVVPSAWSLKGQVHTRPGQ